MRLMSSLQLLPANLSVDKLASSQQQAIAKQRLKLLVANRKQELQQYACILTISSPLCASGLQDGSAGLLQILIFLIFLHELHLLCNNG